LDSLIFISKLGWLTCASSRRRSAALRGAAERDRYATNPQQRSTQSIRNNNDRSDYTNSTR
jgi:hypothetical protein